MPFVLIFGGILLIMGLVTGKFMKKDFCENDYVCKGNYEQAVKDIKNNKIYRRAMIIVGSILIVVGTIGCIILGPSVW